MGVSLSSVLYTVYSSKLQNTHVFTSCTANRQFFSYNIHKECAVNVHTYIHVCNKRSIHVTIHTAVGSGGGEMHIFYLFHDSKQKQKVNASMRATVFTFSLFRVQIACRIIAQ